MNKYKSALSDIMCCVPYGKLKEQEETLQELVEKATPKKAKVIEYWYMDYFDCPNCGNSTWCDGDEHEYKYCSRCGQAIDWSEEDVD